MSVFDIATAQFDGFSPKNIVVLPGGKKNGAEPLVYFVNEYRSQNYVHVRTIYQGNDERWRMGKGISMLEADAAPLFAALGAMVEKPASVPQTKRAVKVK